MTSFDYLMFFLFFMLPTLCLFFDPKVASLCIFVAYMTFVFVYNAY